VPDESPRTALSVGVAPRVAELGATPEGRDLLAGHRRQITAVYCELRGFAALADHAEPKSLLRMLGDYHALVGAAIDEHGGTLERFAGESVMSFFNDPVLQPDHVERAVRMASVIRDRFTPLGEGWRRHGHELGLGIGIAVGHATLGRIGIGGRHDYTAVGNVVLLATRLSTQAAPNQILLSQRAMAMVDGFVDVEPVGEVSLKGFTRPVPVGNVVTVH
jgi:class 3 adenylate cyclase